MVRTWCGSFAAAPSTGHFIGIYLISRKPCGPDRERPAQVGGGAGQLAIAGNGQAAKRQRLLDDVAARRDVGLLVDRDRVGVHMGDVAAGEQKRHAWNLEGALHGAGELLADRHDGGEEVGGSIVEKGEMLARDDLGVTGPDRAAVQEGDEALVLVKDVSRDLALADPAKQAFGFAGHGPDSQELCSHALCSRELASRVFRPRATRFALPQLRSEAHSPRSSRK